ncbi:MAG: hypothetical protein ABJM39_06115 [Porticoccus sp.]|uniref:hypothetical protein n=1 Tax=Porticoccus sp. TaxID=2024853 RepID=UPI0032981F2C
MLILRANARVAAIIAARAQANAAVVNAAENGANMAVLRSYTGNGSTSSAVSTVPVVSEQIAQNGLGEKFGEAKIDDDLFGNEDLVDLVKNKAVTISSGGRAEVDVLVVGGAVETNVTVQVNHHGLQVCLDVQICELTGVGIYGGVNTSRGGGIEEVIKDGKTKPTDVSPSVVGGWGPSGGGKGKVPSSGGGKVKNESSARVYRGAGYGGFLGVEACTRYAKCGDILGDIQK